MMGGNSALLALLALAETNRKPKWQRRCRAETRSAIRLLVGEEPMPFAAQNRTGAAAAAEDLVRRCGICRKCGGV